MGQVFAFRPGKDDFSQRIEQQAPWQGALPVDFRGSNIEVRCGPAALNENGRATVHTKALGWVGA